MFPCLSLPHLASSTSLKIKAKITDEYFEEVPFDDRAHLRDISIMTL